ncbi:phosphoenolpyruvate carboxykinase, GTP-utilising [Kipferlia bialata]|uniref:phosphoenolpyruvate carboxykinase (GTP) n=1 Tax=Kipferlia bialata TaxID=797122 RepID=A0A9K3CQT6_9EUKA|nr:phosphoenolpyruvate carboxykinase, GTP-utilising [Kipferlia bialata]|eukprot:g2014.t1
MSLFVRLPCIRLLVRQLLLDVTEVSCFQYPFGTVTMTKDTAPYLQKLAPLANEALETLVHRMVTLLEPKDVFIATDSAEDQAYIAQMALSSGQETSLATKGHTIHFDGPQDQARDKLHTAVLLSPGERVSAGINTEDRDQGINEVQGLMKGSMKDRTLIVAFYCLGPVHSEFSRAAVQFTDSYYVLHSQAILYRPGFEHFRQMEDKGAFYHFIHASGPLDKDGHPSDIPHRRIYIDPKGLRTFSYGCSYAGNTLACKKLALRLAIHQANHSDWLTEHMFLASYKPPAGGEEVYMAGAYPSACGKTSTAMSRGSSIVGDDIIYMRNIDGVAKAVNIEAGIFGIIKDVNAKDDPVISRVLGEEREIIFSNVLKGDDGKPYWTGMGKGVSLPAKGTNHAGAWTPSDKPVSHGNSRFTLRISELPNASKELHNASGVPVEAVLYGGRDASCTPAVLESLSWQHGVWIGSGIESETTAATLGKEGVRKASPFANMDFLIVPLDMYVANHIKFGATLGDKAPRVFGTNYFLRGEDGQFLNTKLDKEVWLAWTAGRVRKQYGAITTPIGLIPKYDDLRALFAAHFEGRVYTQAEYDAQFSVRVDAYLAKLDRMDAFYAAEAMPQEWTAQHTRLKTELALLKADHGKAVLPPSVFV